MFATSCAAALSLDDSRRGNEVELWARSRRWDELDELDEEGPPLLDWPEWLPVRVCRPCEG